jgi:hypothetical protein
VGTVPDELRPAIAKELTELVEGRLPEQLLLWVREYSEGGATLVPQPEEIWSHPRTDVRKLDTGGYLVVVPLWTADESPSDLSAEMMISPEGTMAINTVRIL